MSAEETRPSALPDGFSVIIPAFNEERAIAEGVRAVRAALANVGRAHEIIVVDDGSADRTAAIAQEQGVIVVRLPQNRGYGAALKAGIARAVHDTIVITDADQSYPAEAIPHLVELTADYDMAVGARVGRNVAIPLVRRPAKWLLGLLASYLAGQHIPDLNSGLRAMRRDLIRRYETLLPTGFSFTSTITLAALCNGHTIFYQPIDYRPRVGESKIRPKHAFDFLILILRVIVYFNPLKVFVPLGGAMFLAGFAKLIYDIVIGNLSESAVMAFLGAAIVWAVGLLSDQIARVGMRLAPP